MYNCTLACQNSGHKLNEDISNNFITHFIALERLLHMENISGQSYISNYFAGRLSMSLQKSCNFLKPNYKHTNEYMERIQTREEIAVI